MELAVVKAADLTKVTVGQTVTYRITVRNTGPSDATGATVTDALPGNLAFLSAESPNGSYDPASGVWTVGDLANGGTATLTVRAKATAAGETVNTATADANEQSPSYTGNSDSVTICVEAAPQCCTPCETWRSSS